MERVRTGNVDVLQWTGGGILSRALQAISEEGLHVMGLRFVKPLEF
jgi:hypothetical protein